MTRDEFTTWLAHYRVAFPVASQKLSGLPNWDEVREGWFTRVFFGIELDIAADAVDAMQAGHTDHPAAYDLDRLPAFVNRYRRETIGGQHRHMSEWKQAELGQRRHESNGAMALVRSDSVMGKAVRLACDASEKASKAGRDPVAAIRDVVLEQIPDDETTTRGAVSCLLCKDSGIVMCWCPDTVRQAIDECPEDQIQWNECGVPCQCNPHTDPENPAMMFNRFGSMVTGMRGKKLVTEQQRRFSATLHVPSGTIDSKDRLLLWAMKYRENRSNGVINVPQNGYQEFADYTGAAQ